MDASQIGSLAAPTKYTHLPRATKPTPFSQLSRTERLRTNGALEDPPESDDDGASSGEDDGEGGASKREAKEKKRMRGRNKTVARLMRKKKKNVIDPATVRTLFLSGLLLFLVLIRFLRSFSAVAIVVSLL